MKRKLRLTERFPASGPQIDLKIHNMERKTWIFLELSQREGFCKFLGMELILFKGKEFVETETESGFIPYIPMQWSWYWIFQRNLSQGKRKIPLLTLDMFAVRKYSVEPSEYSYWYERIRAEFWAGRVGLFPYRSRTLEAEGSETHLWYVPDMKGFRNLEAGVSSWNWWEKDGED